MTGEYVMMWVGYLAVLIGGIMLGNRIGRDNKFVRWALILGVVGWWMDAVFWHWSGWMVPRQRAGNVIEMFLVGQTFTSFYFNLTFALRPLLPIGLLYWITREAKKS